MEAELRLLFVVWQQYDLVAPDLPLPRGPEHPVYKVVLLLGSMGAAGCTVLLVDLPGMVQLSLSSPFSGMGLPGVR